MAQPFADRLVKADGGRRTVVGLYLLFAMAVCYQLWVVTLADIRTVISLTPDDAAYYFKIAEHVARGEGFTFDGINPTNGFQPLWLYVLVVIHRLCQGTPEAMFRVFLFVQLVCLTISAAILNSFISRYVSARTRLISLVLFLSLVFITSNNGMESALLIMLLAFLFSYGWKGRVFLDHHLWREAGFGALLGLVMLSRLDMALLGAAIYAFCLVGIALEKRSRREHGVRFAVILVTSALIVLPYLFFNHVAFGSISPISVQLKSSFPHLIQSSLILQRLNLRYSGIWLASLLYLACSLATARKLHSLGSLPKYHRVSMMIMSSVIGVHFLHAVLFIEWGLWFWHFTPYGLFACLAICEPVEYLLSRRWLARYSAVLPAAVVGFALLGAWHAYQRLQEYGKITDRVPSYETALWVREHTKEDERFALNDAGYFGFFSRRSVVNLDGLVNNMEYQDALRDQRLQEYLQVKGVRYLVGHLFVERDDVVSGTYETYSRSYFSHKHDVRSDEITVHRQAEIYRSPPFYDGNYRTVFIIWALDPSS